MEIVDEVVQFLVDAVTVNLGRYLLIFLLSGMGFIMFGIINMVLRQFTDKPIRFILRRKEDSRVPAWINFVLSVVAAYFLIGWLYAKVPQVSPFTYMNL